MSATADQTYSSDLASQMTGFIEERGDEPVYVTTVISEFARQQHDEEDVRLTILELIASHRIVLGPRLQLSVGK